MRQKGISVGIRTDSADDGEEAQAGKRVPQEVGLAGADKGRALPESLVVVRGLGDPGHPNFVLVVARERRAWDGHRRIRHCEGEVRILSRVMVTSSRTVEWPLIRP